MSARPTGSSASPRDALIEALAAETAKPVAPSVLAAVEALRRRFPQATAVLFYGSCLRAAEEPPDGLMDFYVLAETYEALHAAPLACAMNRRLPPNVYYGEAPFGAAMLRWKVATVSFAQFAEGVKPEAPSAQFWVRFCQSVRLVHAADPQTRARVLSILAQACVTAVGAAAPLAADPRDVGRLWTRLFQETYRTELRPEPASRAALIVARDRAHFEAITAPALALAVPLDSATKARQSWAKRRRLGKLLNAARLVKAAFTFAGAADYAVYKVEKHTGTKIALAPWQRRHALLAAPTLIWAVWRRRLFHSAAER
jgi:hypothetical protein